ncbi:MAG: tetratricopeptide repeat protein [Firmicutes bacterium]|nr:tetratricopeptide repeat protein [Bacillota bacterium]
MTSEMDSGITNSDSIDYEAEKPAEEISLWLVGGVVLFLILMFLITALIVQRVYFQPPVARTAIEKDLLKYKAAIKKNPRNAEAYIGLADVYLEMQDPQSALKNLERAVRLKPNSWNAHFEMGRAYDALGKEGEAIKHFTKAANIDPYNELGFYQLGRVYQNQKNFGRAIEAYKKTLKVNPTLADAHYYLGNCYERTNQIDLAKKEYQEALKYVTDYTEAKKALERLK